MAGIENPQTVADALIRRLREHHVRHVFGYPGGQLTPFYDALAREPSIRHFLARDEQAAAFMADGYARATGRPGVCFAVCGPGVFNAATPLATAFTDSVPLLLISGQVPTKGRGPRSGYYHENDQLAACKSFTKWGARVERVETLLPAVDQAFSTMSEQRPGPVLLEVPLDVQREQYPQIAFPPLPPGITLQFPRPTEIDALVGLLSSWKKPALLAGGGVISANAETYLVQLAERLGAPTFTTLMGKGAIPGDHPLSAGLPWRRATSDLTNMGPLFSPWLSQCDGVLAIGCRFSQAATGSWALPLPVLAQIDIDGSEIGRHYPVQLGMQANAALALRSLLSSLPDKPRPAWAPPLPASEPWRLPGLELLGALRRNLPRDAIVAADICRLSYILLADFPVYQPRTFLHPAGFVAMGHGLPAALGAKAAFPDRTVVAIAGDGCFLMSGMELATMVQEKLPVIVILVNDSSLTLIKQIQERKYEGRYLGVDLQNPDFGLFARAFGVRAWRAESDGAFDSALREAVASKEPAIIEVVPGMA